MSRPSLVALIGLLLAGTLAADVLVTKDGARVSGKVVDKGTHYEVATPAGLRTYLKEDVEKIITDPKELLGDADAVYEEAKKGFLAALSKSIKQVPYCEPCGGEGKFRCTNCHGRKKQEWKCETCKGRGYTLDKQIEKFEEEGFKIPEEVLKRFSIKCLPCKGSGIAKALVCKKCPDGFLDCKRCKGPTSPPALEEICESAPCGVCEGRGLAFRGVRWPCRVCKGPGVRLIPKAEPARVLP
jgi:hypothetical protein